MVNERKRGKESGDANLGGMFKSLGGFIGMLSELAEKGEEITRSGELGDALKKQIGVDGKKGVKAVYGFSVRFGGDGNRVEPFGNVKVDNRGTAVVEDAREPMVDVFDEEDHVAVVAELPGVDAKDVRFTVKDDVLDLSAGSGERKYHKEVPLPGAVDVAKAQTSYHNGVFELRLPKVK
jgi:HSP20 family protein